MASTLAEEFPGVGWRMVFGAMDDKDVDGMLDLLAGAVTVLHAVAADSPRALDPEDVAERFRARSESPARVHASVGEGVAEAVASGDPVLITGSIYVVGEARRAFGLG